MFRSDSTKYEDESRQAASDLYRFSMFHDRSLFQRNLAKDTSPRRKEPSRDQYARIKARLAKVNEDLEDPNIISNPARHKALFTLKAQLEQMVDDSLGLSKIQETEDFNQWILGKGKEQDHVRTPWYRTPLIDLPGVRDYVLQFVKDRFKFLEYVHSLQMMGPKDIKEALEYFRFIIRGKEEGKLNYLEEWSRIDTMKQMTRKYGKQVAERLADWPISRGSVMPGDGMKLLATDFQSYIGHHWEKDEDKRRALFEEDGIREELLVRLASMQHHEDISRAMGDYYNRVEEKENLMYLNISARTELTRESKEMEKRFQALPADIRSRAEVAEAYEQRRSMFQRQIAATEEKIRGFLRGLSNDPDRGKKLQKIRELIARRHVPAAVKAVIMGNADESDLMVLIQKELEAGSKLVDSATLLSNKIKWAADLAEMGGFYDEQGFPDLTLVDKYADLLRDIDTALVELRNQPANRPSNNPNAN